MNLLFLVEGASTEYKIYHSWISHLFPYLSFVAKPEDMITDSYRIIAGNGYPNILNFLESCLQDIKNYNNVDYFFICLDSEENTYQYRFDEINNKLQELKSQVGISQNQATKFHVIVQNCCIETWFLGNAEIPNKYDAKNNSRKLPDFQAHHDILVDDPELMIDHPPSHPYRTKAKFHEDYLKEYLKEFGLSYSKRNPRVASEKEYLDALIKRCLTTNHLSSLKYLLDIWEEIRKR